MLFNEFSIANEIQARHEYVTAGAQTARLLGRSIATQFRRYYTHLTHAASRIPSLFVVCRSQVRRFVSARRSLSV